MKKNYERKRHTKGTLSVLDEFTGETGVIQFEPQLDTETQERINQSTKLADAPIEKKNKITSFFEKETQPERSHKGGYNVEITEPKRSQEGGHNVAIEKETQPERSHKGGYNVEITEPKRSQEGGHNVAIENRLSESDPTLLVGTQRKVFKYFFDISRQFASLRTPSLTLESISAATGLRESQIHSATKQLRKKNCIALTARKDGRSGWVEYSVNQRAFDLWIRLENAHNRSQNVEITELKRSQEGGHKAVHNAPYSSSNDLYNKETTTTAAESLSIPENLKRFGVSVVNLQNLITAEKTTLEIARRSLSALAFDVENGKTGNLANILFGVLGSGREYISQKYSETLQAELDQELARIAQAEENQKRSAELQLTKKFKEYLQTNPDFIESIKAKHSSFVTSNELLEKVAFEEFKASQALF